MRTAELHLPAGQNYECLKCGRGCEMFEEITLDATSEARLRALGVEDLLPSERRGLPWFKQSLLERDRNILEKQVGGRCVFVTEDQLCSIHARYGEPAKPQTCRDFPIRYVETENGVYGGLSFACTAALLNHGPAMESQREELAQALSTSNARREVGTILLTPRLELAWPVYEGVEADLRAMLQWREASIAEALVAQSVYLDLLVAALKEQRGSLYNNAPSEEDAAVLQALRRRFLKDDGEPLLKLARRVRGSQVLQSAFLGLMTAFRGNLSAIRKPGRIESILRITRHYALHALRIGRIDLQPLRGRFGYDAFTSVRFPMDGEQEELLRRYLGHVLFRKDLLLGENVWLAHRLVLMQFALVRWYAVGLAALAAKSEVTPDDLREAVSLVERYYAFHTSFAKLFENVPALGMVLDSAVRKPIFAASMVLGERE